MPSPVISMPVSLELSVVVPVRNEAENIEPLLSEIRAALTERIGFEVIYVDDGSDDETPAVLARMAAGFHGLRVIRHRASCGQSAAITTGVRAARAEWIVTLDGDGQNDPADIPKLLDVLGQPDRDSRLQMVGGHRRKRRDNWLRRLSSRVANGVRSRLLRDQTPDTGCGLKLFQREAFLALPNFDHMHRFLAALIIRGGGSVHSVEVNHRPRARGRSKYGLHNRLWVGIVDLAGVMWLQRRTRHPIIAQEDL